MKTLRSFFMSNFFLALVAMQVFQQVWSLATGWNLVGALLTIGLAYWLGGMAGHADYIQRYMTIERNLARDIAQLQEEFDALPVSERLADTEDYKWRLEAMVDHHKVLVSLCQIPYIRPRIRDLFPSPSSWLARRRERKILSTAEVKHG